MDEYERQEKARRSRVFKIVTVAGAIFLGLITVWSSWCGI